MFLNYIKNDNQERGCYMIRERRGRPKKRKIKMARVGTRVSPGVREDLQRYADYRGISVSAVISEAVAMKRKEIKSEYPLK